MFLIVAVFACLYLAFAGYLTIFLFTALMPVDYFPEDSWLHKFSLKPIPELAIEERDDEDEKGKK